MVLHIGGERVVQTRHVLALVDISSASMHDTAAFLQLAREQGNVLDSEETPKTIVLTEHSGNVQVYISPISAMTLMKRCEKLV